jgi:hypothetical protein
MIDLLDITLLTISGTDDTSMFLEHLHSLCYSKKHINFGKIKILSPIKPIELADDVEYVKIKNLSYIHLRDIHLCLKTCFEAIFNKFYYTWLMTFKNIRFF